MNFSAKQKWMMKRSTARLNIAEGAVRSSKTVGTTAHFIRQLPYASRKGDIVIIGKTLDSLKRNIINPMMDWLGNDCYYYPGKRELHLWDRIAYTIGANDERAEGKLRGSTISLALGDEITLWPESFFKMLDSRLSLKDSQFHGTTNPDNPKHWLRQDYLMRWEELDLFNSHWLIDDNPFLDKAYIRNIKLNYTGMWYKRFILGLWVAAEGAIYDFFDEGEHTLTRTPEADYYIVGVDYGTTNPCVFTLFGVNRNTRPMIWAEREYYYDSSKESKKKTDKQYSADFIDFCKEYLGTYWQTKVRATYVDPSAESFQTQLKEDGVLSVRNAKNDVLPGIQKVATMLSLRLFGISVNCPRYIEEMYAYVWDEKARERGEDKPKKVDDHCQDAGRYAIYSEFGDGAVDLSILGKM